MSNLLSEYSLDDLREFLNHYVELQEENNEYRNKAIQDAKTISKLRHRIGILMDEIRELEGKQ